MELIRENVTVMLQKGEVLKAAKLQPGKRVVFEKLHFMPDNAIGQPYNSWFQVSSNQLEKIDNRSNDTKVEKEDPDDAESSPKEAAGDNRLLDDSYGKSQMMCREKIVGMKTSGAKGEDIVNEIVKNSATFSSKTTFSQKKYLKKKHKKHLTNIRILKPSARLLCKMYESREPAKICHMRTDNLSQILTLANVHYGSKIVVVETCSGLLLSLLMERLAGSGAIVNLHTGETPTNLHAVTHMNFPDSYWSTLHSLPICKVGPLLANKTFEESVGEITEDGNKAADSLTVLTDADVKESETVSDKNSKKTPLTEAEKCEIRAERKRKRLQHQRLAWTVLRQKNMDTVILACRFHPTPVLLPLLEFLAPSRPFVVHCENKEPLMELFVQLSISSKAINLNISETFMRRYQILPEQTHPHVTMSTTGGYLLTGIKVKPHKHKPLSIHDSSTIENTPAKKAKVA